MGDLFLLVFIIILFAIAGWIGVTAGRLTTNGHWHKRYRHTCGYHTEYKHNTKPCGGCGADDGQWEVVTMRALVFGWEAQS
ncbi:hypothetical protein ATL17_1617 [Maritalea mobilis]|uniref:Uncharacterized protein n=1 Tax=Maritalea mobilis TaxID=483324 RepID=A0A4R6VN55_9HYPH|nr:hypothetical protein ATL17_1617 [Maritalea mobilis]